MCARLSRIFRALDNRTSRKAVGVKVPSLPTEDVSDADSDAFLEQHLSLCAMQPPNDSSGLPNSDSSNSPLDSEEYQLIRALFDIEKFMRRSVNLNLPLLKAIEADISYFTPIPQAALSWVLKAGDLASTFCHNIVNDSDTYWHIVRDEVHLTPALHTFLRLISTIRSCRLVWHKRPANLWAWPERASVEQDTEMLPFCPYTDIVSELEEVQRLLKVQDSSRDRLKRSNFSTARKVQYKAFARSSRLLAIRLDVGFRRGFSHTATASAQALIAVETQPDIFWAKKCIAEFIAHLSKVFGRGRFDYIWKVEYGIKKGFHWHFVILLNGHKHQLDVSIARQLGEHWAKEICAGQGVYFNCNAIKWRYTYKGIGKIDRSDTEKREILDMKVVQYLVKYDLPFQLLKQNKFRQFGTSALRMKNLPP